MADSKRLLTQAGYDKLQAELDDLKVNSRKEIAEKIKEASIEEIEDILKHAEVMEDHPDDGSVSIGSRVTIREVGTDFDMVIDIVGSSEANSIKGKISNESPVGAAVMHRHAGDTVTVDSMEGPLQYEIISVEHSV